MTGVNGAEDDEFVVEVVEVLDLVGELDLFYVAEEEDEIFDLWRFLEGVVERKKEEKEKDLPAPPSDTHATPSPPSSSGSPSSTQSASRPYTWLRRARDSRPRSGTGARPA
ncbi:hypothetical protein KC345_g1 [Hortaea werneckii]|nr:hypothetical protein KC345_g1 [Hortaea werneckii]